jgi:hypothetical protein
LYARNFAFLILFAGFALAQAPAAPPQDDLPIYRLDARLVVLHASVVDKNGKLLTNIPFPWASSSTTAAA